ncbi:cupin domain-containing protein [Bacillus massiliglaciei]|uniref:cupin domain-containing protein n=1 Tax=Bacillus massiliglaciei TaxID=1816693 RepID=UPI000AE35488|nr:cupin domain-containing protein [Bacillus massiliglaciei]
MAKSGFVPDNRNIKKSSGTPNLFFDSRDSVFFERDRDNIAYKVSSTQMPAMLGGAFVDLYLTKGHIREPHWHPNAWELDVIVSGEAAVSIVDPDTNRLHEYRAKAGQVVFIPMAWWHWIRPVSDKLHLHLFFNNDQFESAEGSSMLRHTPPEVFQLAYGVEAGKIADALAPIQEQVVIGPPEKAKGTRPAPKQDRKSDEISVTINHKRLNG